MTTIRNAKQGGHGVGRGDSVRNDHKQAEFDRSDKGLGVEQEGRI